jgi:hypothetical protein
MKATVTITWPPMPTHHTAPGAAMTDAIAGDATITLEDGKKFNFKVGIPQTPVDMQYWLFGLLPNPMHWRVDECEGQGMYFEFTIDLPPEDCYIRVSKDGVYMDVSQILCEVKFTLPDGRKGSGMMVGTKCKSWPRGKGEWLVDEVTYGPMECEVA